MNGNEFSTIRNVKKEIASSFSKESNNFEKAHIKAHTRKTKSGKLVQVKDHQDKRHSMRREMNLNSEQINKFINDVKQGAGWIDEDYVDSALEQTFNSPINEISVRYVKSLLHKKGMIGDPEQKFQTSVVNIDGIGECRVKWKYEGQYMPATREQPEEYPEVYIEKIQPLNGKKEINVDSLSSEQEDKLISTLEQESKEDFEDEMDEVFEDEMEEDFEDEEFADENDITKIKDFDKRDYKIFGNAENFKNGEKPFTFVLKTKDGYEGIGIASLGKINLFIEDKEEDFDHKFERQVSDIATKTSIKKMINSIFANIDKSGVTLKNMKDFDFKKVS